MDSGSKRSEGWYSYYRSWRHPGHSWCHHRVVPKPSRYGFRYLEYRNSAYMKQLLIHFTQWSPPRVFHCAVYRAWCGKWECDVSVTSLLIETNTSLLASSIAYTSILHSWVADKKKHEADGWLADGWWRNNRWFWEPEMSLLAILPGKKDKTVS